MKGNNSGTTENLIKKKIIEMKILRENYGFKNV